MGTKIAILEMMSTHDFTSVQLPAQSILYPQRCLTQSLTHHHHSPELAFKHQSADKNCSLIVFWVCNTTFIHVSQESFVIPLTSLPLYMKVTHLVTTHQLAAPRNKVRYIHIQRQRRGIKKIFRNMRIKVFFCIQNTR
jgi:hypothetical protein